jgi:hypothetical protein
VLCSRWSFPLTNAHNIVFLRSLEDIDESGDAPEPSQYPTLDADRRTSYVHESLADSLPQPILDDALAPPLLSAASPEPLWLPRLRARLDKLISVFATSAFQLLWRPRDGTSVIKPTDLIPNWRSTDQQHKLRCLRRLVAIIFQEYTLLCISPAGSFESAARNGALISQGRR